MLLQNAMNWTTMFPPEKYQHCLTQKGFEVPLTSGREGCAEWQELSQPGEREKSWIATATAEGFWRTGCRKRCWDGLEIEGGRAEGRAKKKEHEGKEFGVIQERWAQEGKSLRGRWVQTCPWRRIKRESAHRSMVVVSTTAKGRD